MKKRIISLALAFFMLLSYIPGAAFASETGVEDTTAQTENVVETASDRTTIYFSTSGSDWYSGTSESRPKKDITKIPTYLAKGYNVKLKRGDIWYLPTQSIVLDGIAGTEESPVVLGSYGDASDPKPTIAFLKQIQDSAWTLVDAENNIYKTDVSDMIARDDTDIRVHRLFDNDAAYLHKSITDYTLLQAEQYCDYGGTLYVRTNGGAPTGVEVTPYAGSGRRVTITNASYLTVENIHIKGSSALNPVMQLAAPTSNVKIKYCDITHCFYYILQIVAGSDTAEDNYKPEISHCYIDACFSAAEGTHFSGSEGGDDHWSVGRTEGITMRDAVDGAWIHHNTIRNMSHGFITIESLDKGTHSKTNGVRNCIIEDNVLEGGNAAFARAFNICAGYNLSGVQMCRDNTFRRNKCYDMTTSSHLYGENTLVYSNLFSYTHNRYNEHGNLATGKGPQPWGFDSVPWDDYVAIGNVIVNNTFYDVGGAIVLRDTMYSEPKVYDNIYANNLIVNWTSDNADYAGAFHDYTRGDNYVMNNGVYAQGRTDHFVFNGKAYLAEEANELQGYSGNVSGDPKFQTADLSVTGLGKKQSFALSSASPYCFAGLAIDDEVYKNFPAWSKMLADYTDVNGEPYDPDTPSIGAYAYQASEAESLSIKKITTTVDPIAIVKNYSQYWGDEWEEALGYKNVTVELSNGNTGTVAVEWDYSALGDTSAAGWYTVTGKLASRAYANPDGLTVQRVINIQKPTNLFTNPGFETAWTAWTGQYNLSWKVSDSYEGNYALGAQSHPTFCPDYLSYCLMKSTTTVNSVDVAEKVAALGAGQYYIGAKVKDYVNGDEVTHTEPLSVFIKLSYNTDGGTSYTYKGQTQAVRISHDDYVTVGGNFDLDGTDKSLFTELFMTSTSKFYGQWVLVDDMQFIPLKVTLKGLPANIESIVTTIPDRAIAQNYDTYVGENWLEAMGLPTTVEVLTDDGETATVEVIWDGSKVDFTQLGRQTIVGTLSEKNLLNSKNLTVKQNIVVREVENLFTNGGFEDDWASNWSGRYYLKWNRIPAAEGSVAVAVQSSAGGSWGDIYPLMQSTNANKTCLENTNGIADKVAVLGAGQYYVGGKVKDFVEEGEETHADPLKVFIRLSANDDGSTNWSTLGDSEKVTINHDNYVSVGKTFDLTGTEKSFYTELYMQSATTFYGQWVLVDDMEFILLNQEMKAHEHSYTESVTTAPTCTEEGVKTYTCECSESYTEVIAALGHSYNAVVTAPTCVANGYTTYTCSACGDSYKDNETAATGHAYDNDQDATCNNCGEIREVGPATDANLKFNAAPGLSFKDYIGMQILVTSQVANNYDRVWIEAVQADPAGDVTTTLEGVPYFYNIYLKFEQQVLSWSMAENITLTLWAEKDGETVKGETFSGSVEDLALAKIAEYAAANNTAAVTALVDMLNYGAAVQTSFNHNADMLPNTNLGSYTGTTATPEFSATNSITGTGTLAVASNSISMQAKVEIQLLIMGKIDGYTVSATVGGAAAPVVVDTEKYAAYNWTLVKVAVAADKMREVYTISINDANGTPVTSVYNVSVEAYGKTQLEGAKADVVIAMMRYGDSVAAL